MKHFARIDKETITRQMLLSLLEIKHRDLLEVEVPSDATIRDVKQAVSAAHGFPLLGMRIIITRDSRPAFCPDDSTVASLGITDSDVLKLYAKGVTISSPPPPPPHFEIMPLPRRKRRPFPEALLSFFSNRWTPDKWREMLAHSRHPLTPEDSQVLHIITAGNPVLYTFVLKSGAPFWTYRDRAEILLNLVQELRCKAFISHFLVEHLCIFQELMLAAIESEADAMRRSEGEAE
jgi:hypothetical protein